MSDNLFSSAKPALSEALALASEILKNIELNEISLTNAALKAGRLARVLGDFEHQQMFHWEAGGYPTTSTGVPSGAWKIAVTAGREFTITTKAAAPAPPKKSQAIYLDSIEALEYTANRLAAAKDPENPRRIQFRT